jgi:hypothetical protein
VVLKLPSSELLFVYDKKEEATKAWQDDSQAVIDGN